MQSTYIRHGSSIPHIYSQPLIQPRRNYCWKPNLISNTFIIERPHTDEFLFYTDANTKYKVTFPNSKTNSNVRYTLNDVKASYKTRQYEITTVKDPLVTTSKIPLYPYVDVVKENKFKYIKKNKHQNTSTVSPLLSSHSHNKYHPHQEKQHNPTNYTQSTTFNNNNRIKQHHQRSNVSSNKNTVIPDNYYTNNTINHLPFHHQQQQYSQSPCIIPPYNYPIQYYYYYGNSQQHYHQPIINEINNEKGNQRRISANTVDSASTTTNYDFKPRRYSSGSTNSSKSTILSSMESLTMKIDDSTGLEIEKCTLSNDNMNKSAASFLPTDKVDAQTNKNNDDDEHSILHQQQQQYLSHEDDNTSYKGVTFASTLDIIIPTDDNNLSNDENKIESKPNTDINNSVNDNYVENDINKSNNNEVVNNNKNVNQYTSISSPTSSSSTSSSLSSSLTSISKSSSSTTTNTTSTSITTTNGLDLPIWADPIKIKENPTRYKEVQVYMKKNNIPLTSVLPLPKQVVFYFGDTSKTKSGADDYRSTMDTLFICKTIWEYSARWRRYKEVYERKPSYMSINQNLYCFHKGVEPMWEDETNKDGGRLTLCPGRGHLDEIFDWLLCSFVGGSLLTFGMVGIVFSRRARADRIELWLDASANTDVLSNLRKKLTDLLPPSVYDVIKASKYKKHFDKKK